MEWVDMVHMALGMATLGTVATDYIHVAVQVGR